MTTLDLLQHALDNPSPHEDHALQFDKIVTCIEQEKMEVAADMIEKIFEKGNTDIRLIVYYLFAHFFDRGFKSFIDIFPLLSTLLKEHWNALRPSNRKEKQIENSLAWLTSQLINKLKYVQKIAKAGTQANPIWEELLAMTADERNQAIAALSKFKDFFYERWPKSPTKERVMHLLHLAEELKTLATVQTEEENVPEPINIEPPPPVVKEAETPTEEVVETTREQIQEKNVEGLSCENLPLLVNKLKAFEQLISKEEWTKAAIVAKDINHQLANFDPLFYFPKLVSRYFAVIAKHVSTLSGHWENQDAQFAYLEKLYQTDIDQFHQW